MIGQDRLLDADQCVFTHRAVAPEPEDGGPTAVEGDQRGATIVPEDASHRLQHPLDDGLVGGRVGRALPAHFVDHRQGIDALSKLPNQLLVVSLQLGRFERIADGDEQVPRVPGLGEEPVDPTPVDRSHQVCRVGIVGQ